MNFPVIIDTGGVILRQKKKIRKILGKRMNETVGNHKLGKTRKSDFFQQESNLTILTSLAIVAFGTVSFISRGMTGSQDVGRSLTGGPFLEPARRNVAEFDLCGGGGA